ncbi:MAG: tyrosine-type recombinase/integrase [Chitinophagaceae bacterium]|nr:tyrosine-type recombinase/integrase [Chitinophagaceae bacterium]
MKKVTLKPLYHKNQECIGIYFENTTVLNGAIRKNAGAKWSQTNKCWYIPLSKENYNKLFFALKGKAAIEQSALHEYLAAKKKKVAPAKTSVTAKPVTPAMLLPTTSKKQVTVYKGGKIQAVNAHVIPAMEQHLKLKAYSPSTIKTYLGEMTQLLTILKTIPADDLTPELLKRYLIYCYEKLKLTENTLHSRINAMKFYYEQVLKRDKFFWEIPRPKKPFLLPKLLNETELTNLFNALANKKHKAMLFTAYSSGLRVSEIVNLKISDIDSKRMQILVQRAKGKKDRYVNLSPLVLDILRKYIQEYKPRPKVYLFESEQTFTAYPTRTVQQIFTNAKHKAGIRKEVGIHSLRHSLSASYLNSS